MFNKGDTILRIDGKNDKNNGMFIGKIYTVIDGSRPSAILVENTKGVSWYGPYFKLVCKKEYLFERLYLTLKSNE